MRALAARGIRDVVFDLGGVLIDWDPRYLFRDRLGLEPGAVEEFLATVCTPEWHARVDAGRPFRAAAAELAARFPDRRDWIEAYCDGWADMFAGHFDDALGVVRELQQAGFAVHALSNHPADHVAWLYRRFPFMREFDTVVISGLVGVTKPNRAIYEHLRAALRQRPCVFLDDRLENVVAARDCGIEALHVASPGAVRALLGA